MEAFETDSGLGGSLVRNWVNVKRFISISFWPTRACTAAKCTREKLCVTIKLERLRSVCHRFWLVFPITLQLSRECIRGWVMAPGEIVSSFENFSRVAADANGTFWCHALLSSPPVTISLMIRFDLWIDNRMIDGKSFPPCDVVEILRRKHHDKKENMKTHLARSEKPSSSYGSENPSFDEIKSKFT